MVEVAEPIEAITLIEEEIRDSYIEIVDRVDRSVVTVIEILSPTNKMPRFQGTRELRVETEGVMRSPTHLVEIDLLRRGLPIPVYSGIPEHEYLVHVSRANGGPGPRSGRSGCPRSCRRSGSRCKAEDENVALDLQAVLTAAYDRAGYDLEIDYGGEPGTAARGGMASLGAPPAQGERPAPA